ncbi:MAG: hypothetical protein PHT73_00355 [bacterium]|nr:hypothetical protein [bacterium]
MINYESEVNRLKAKDAMKTVARHLKDEAQMQKQLLKDVQEEPARSAISKYFQRMRNDRRDLMRELSRAGKQMPRTWLSIIISTVAALAATAVAYYFSSRGAEETLA